MGQELQRKEEKSRRGGEEVGEEERGRERREREKERRKRHFYLDERI